MICDECGVGLEWHAGKRSCAEQKALAKFDESPDRSGWVALCFMAILTAMGFGMAMFPQGWAK